MPRKPYRSVILQPHIPTYTSAYDLAVYEFARITPLGARSVGIGRPDFGIWLP